MLKQLFLKSPIVNEALFLKLVFWKGLELVFHNKN